MKDDPVTILSAKRTPIGNFQGSLKNSSATELGSIAIKACLDDAKINPEQIDSVIMGCVLPAGLGQAPARQAAIKAGIPYNVGATTINKACGSGMKAVMFAHDGIVAGSYQLIVAGAMESMTNAPYLLPDARAGYRIGHHKVIDHMFFDGLEDAYKHYSMGEYAEKTVEKFGFTREQQDDFAKVSVERAQAAQQNKIFAKEIIPVVVKDKKGETIVTNDDGPQYVKIDKISRLRPAFKKDGTVTAANSSSISDGAAALLLCKQTYAIKIGAKPIAKITAHSTHSQEPAWFTTAPIGAIKKVLKKTGWSIDDVDLFEINEAFAVVVMVAMKELNLPHNKVNIHGGACVLGHPLACSGARIIVTLLNALRTKNLKRGIAALCIGGGEATALAIELL